MSTPPTTASEIDNEECLGIEPPSNIHKLETFEIPKSLDQAPCKTLKATTSLAAPFSTAMRRRQLLGAAGTIAAGAAAATLLNAPAVHAATLTDYF